MTFQGPYVIRKRKGVCVAELVSERQRTTQADEEGERELDVQELEEIIV